MKYGVGLVVGIALLASTTPAVWAHSEHDHDHGEATTQQTTATGAAQEQTLTGEVVDVFCYLSHGKEGLGKGHAGCAKKCIQSGLPVAIKVGNQLYLASMADHTAANQKLGDLAAEQVTVRGKVMEADGQRLIAISSFEKAE
jgi:hypothetical protein